jgi:3-hydroxymyristoyl/3-hydroxydecanoyl-(acyl carrier protein) dehydratase
MSKLFPDSRLLQCDASLVELQLDISADIAYFEGHFPQAPVLAGVTQLHWAVEYSQQYFTDLASVSSVEVLKFQTMIRPADILLLRLQRAAEHTVLFSYIKGEDKMASGRLKWTLKTDA